LQQLLGGPDYIVNEFVADQLVHPHIVQQLLLLLLLVLLRELHLYRSTVHATTGRRNQPIASGVENDGHRPRWKMNLFRAQHASPVVATHDADRA